MSLQQFFSILRARWNAALMILLATLALAVAFIVLRPAQYTARAPVLVDLQASDVGGGYSPSLLASYMATQMDIARSDRVVERVLDTLDNPSGGAQPARGVSGAADSQRRERLRDLQEQLEVKPARESNIINISYTASSAGEAARIANAFARAYVDVSLDIKTGPAKTESNWFDQQVKEARQRLEQAQTKLSEFQQRAGIVGNDEMADHEMARLTTLATQLAQIQAQTTDSQSRRNSSRDTVAEVMQSPLINTLKADIGKLEAQLQQGGATMGPRHPAMMKMEAELGALRSRLASETGRIGSSIETSYQASRAREQELTGALNAQRSRVLSINKERGALALLRNDLDSARRAFETVSNNASKSRLQALTTQTNLMMLAPAVEPRQAKGPTPAQALGVAAVAGLLLALAGAFLMELLNRRVRSVDDVAMATQLPVLASLPAASPAFTALPASRRRLALTASGSPA
ncbi:MAG TPA: Wzz/FepE/Etk N-terminal domain-containing protein [Ramlibacter sp.]|nr:Wzz/FepE/Etk N-terminal domain-containing protein [Ramlibacter sp.]